MKKPIVFSAFKFLIIVCLSAVSCSGQEVNQTAQEQESALVPSFTKMFIAQEQFPKQLLGPYSNNASELEAALNIRLDITSIIQDKSGTLWIGTNGYGVIRFQDDSLEYLSVNDGFRSARVRDMVEDKSGNIWFATENGVIRYKAGAMPLSFSHFTESENLSNNDVLCLALDRNDNLWIGTSNGVSIFKTSKKSGSDRESIESFELPAAKNVSSEIITERQTINSITEDKNGRMWFGTDQGVFVFDASAENPFSHISTDDGLCDNEVKDILEDKNGRIYFATRNDGVCFLDEEYTAGIGALSFVQLDIKDGHNGTEVTHLYEDKAGIIWFSVNGVGVYRVDGESLTEFFPEQSCVSHTLRSIYEDNQGRIWFGGWLGLFRYDRPC